jgi:DNA-binding HxlR family transcriptional regulator
MGRAYEQHCSLAHALDLVGERWTLLIVRELLVGPRRYTDLADGLVSIPTNVLAARLRELERNGLVHRRRLPAPAASVSVYELTDDGEALADAVTELARWGMRTLPARTEGRPFRAHWLVLALGARFDRQAAVGVSESYELVVEGEGTVCFEVNDGEGSARLGPASNPAVRVEADADTLVALAAGEDVAAEALARGARVQIEGDAAALERMRRILPARRALSPSSAQATPAASTLAANV